MRSSAQPKEWALGGLFCSAREQWAAVMSAETANTQAVAVDAVPLEEADTSGWVQMAGTALSGLGATLNGMSSLYGVTVGHSHSSSSDHDHGARGATSSMAGNMASGALALLGGFMASTKLGTVGTGLSLGTVGLGAGCAYASIGFLYFMYSIARLTAETPPKHAPAQGSAEAKLFPSPDWLSTRVLNWGVMGRVGVGKSTLINSLRGLQARNADAAPVGIGHTTRSPKPYNFVGDVATLTRNMARLWDLPGAGTKDWPCSTYIRDAGLRHFDGVLFVTSDAFSEVEASLMQQLQEFKVPYYLVRNKVDQDVANNAEDNGRSLEASLAEIRHELFQQGCDPSRTFLISAKHPQCADFEFGLLLRTMANDVVDQRSALPEFADGQSVPSLQAKDTKAFAAASMSKFSALRTPSPDPHRCRALEPKADMRSNLHPTSCGGHYFETPPPTRLHAMSPPQGHTFSGYCGGICDSSTGVWSKDIMQEADIPSFSSAIERLQL